MKELRDDQEEYYIFQTCRFITESSQTTKIQF